MTDAKLSEIDGIEPAILYHYTSLNAMMEIVRTRKIWATGINYLNDVMERRLFLDVVSRELPNFASTNGLDDFSAFQNILESGSSAFNAITVVDQPLVASFSADPDSLMHWRSYCPEANGVSIGFRTNCLKEARCIVEVDAHRDVEDRLGLPFQVPAPTFKKIEYIERWASQTSVLQAMEMAYSDALRFIEDNDNLEVDERTSISTEQLFAFNLEAAASFFKHSSFYGEREYRLLIGSLYFRADVLKFRTSRSALVPYIELSIPGRDRNSFPLPQYRDPQKYWDAIEEVILGPSPNQALSKQALEAFFYSQGMDVTVRSSAVPYRDW